MTGGSRAFTCGLVCLAILSLSTPAEAGRYLHPPREENRWPIEVFARADSFQFRYKDFLQAQFHGVKPERLPAWLDVETDSLGFGESVVARLTRVEGNEDAIRTRLLDLVSHRYEIGLTQFGPEPRFPAVNFVLGHRDGSLTLVPFDANETKEPLLDLDVVHYLVERCAFLTDGEDDSDRVVLTRGNLQEVDIWYPTLACEVLHTHTIPGNINPTGYLEYFEGSDRDMVLVSREFQLPLRGLVLPAK